MRHPTLLEMTHEEFMATLDEPRVLAAIATAETATSGEIRLCVARAAEPDPLAAARRAFARLGMIRTRDRNGVLILVAPVSRTFAIVGDEGINRHCGDEFWSALAAEMGGEFAAGRPTDGIARTVQKVGEVLARHFPRDRNDTNELPDSIATE